VNILDFILVYCSVISLIFRNFSNLFLGRMPALQKAVEVDVCLEVTRKKRKKHHGIALFKRANVVVCERDLKQTVKKKILSNLRVN